MHYFNDTYSELLYSRIEPLAEKTSVCISFEFDSSQYAAYLYEAEPFMSSLQKVGAILALFNIGGLLLSCHKSGHEKSLTKRFLRRLHRQEREEDIYQ